MIYRVKARLKHINKDQHDNHCASRHSTWPACWGSDHVPPRNKMIINNLYFSEVEFSAQHLLGPILVRYLRIAGQNLVRKMDYFGE